MYSVTYTQPGWWCDTCDDGVLEGEDNIIGNQVFMAVRAIPEGIYSATQVKPISHVIEQEVVLPVDGKLPDAFQDAFGRKVRVIVLLPEPNPLENSTMDHANRLMEFARTIDWPMEDPVACQRQQRRE